ncbi:hypothetical protein [Blautia intestinalis]|uniref:hypothetical protein n=1 Tax=Blautia intestinalis TaxID=2763028 RepID=UPI0022E3E8B5|nr:hypothetical protein [Blautia intestinalis]
MLLIIIVFLSCFCNAAICFFSSPFSDVTSFKTVFFSLAVLPVKLFFAEVDYSHSKNLENIFVKLAVQSAYMYQSQEISCHSADKGYG